MAKQSRIICNASDLIDQGLGVRFDLPELGQHVTGFALRYHGKVYAYVNQCAHLPVELDWNHGDFMNLDKTGIICATHGAQYYPQTGVCYIGPCKGKRLQAIEVIEENEQIIILMES